MQSVYLRLFVGGVVGTALALSVGILSLGRSWATTEYAGKLAIICSLTAGAAYGLNRFHSLDLAQAPKGVSPDALHNLGWIDAMKNAPIRFLNPSYLKGYNASLLEIRLAGGTNDPETLLSLKEAMSKSESVTDSKSKKSPKTT